MTRRQAALRLAVAVSTIAAVATVSGLGSSHGRADAAVPTYSIVDLGVLPGGSESQGFGISASGNDVAGQASDSGGLNKPALWHNGSITNLGTLGGSQGAARDVNSSGVVVGIADDASGNSRAFSGTSAGISDLGTLGGSTATAEGVDSAGTVVGAASPSGSGQQPVFWDGNGIHALPELAGDVGGQALDISDAGAIVGGTSTSTVTRPIRWDAGTHAAHDLGTLGGTNGLAFGVDSLGQLIVGYSATSAGPLHAFLYASGAMTDLGTLGGSSSFAAAVNAAGQIVGNARTATNATHAFVRRDGIMYDLNDLVPASAGATISTANDINDAGTIAGTARLGSPSQIHAVVLVPDSTPPTSTTTTATSTSTTTPSTTTSTTTTTSTSTTTSTAPPTTTTTTPTSTTAATTTTSSSTSTPPSTTTTTVLTETSTTSFSEETSIPGCDPPDCDTGWSPHNTEVVAALGATVVYDRTVRDEPGSAAAVPAEQEARAALLAAGASPALIYRTVTHDQIAKAALVSFESKQNYIVSATRTIGPATIGIGRDNSVPYFVPPNTANTNTHTLAEIRTYPIYQSPVDLAHEVFVALPLAQTTTAGPAQKVLAGGSVHVSGGGFAPKQQLKVTLHTAPIELGTITSDVNGNFDAQLTIPLTATPGDHHLAVTGLDPAGQPREVDFPLVVTASAKGVLSFTGGNSGPLVVFAGFLLLIGVGMRRSARSSKEQGR